MRKNVSRWGYRFLKRLFDILISLPLALLFTPFMLLIMIAIPLMDWGSPFFCQARVGQNGKMLRIVKFRTMRKCADDLKQMLTPEQYELYKREYKLEDDPRLIGYRRAGDGKRCFGALLRRTSVDELPQLWWNVLLCGNMSLVGPRPVLKDEITQHYSEEEQKAILSVKPGVTGYWQAYARNMACYENGERQRMELFYAENHSLWLDLKILFATVGRVLSKNGAK